MKGSGHSLKECEAQIFSFFRKVNSQSEAFLWWKCLFMCSAQAFTALTLRFMLLPCKLFKGPISGGVLCHFNLAIRTWCVLKLQSDTMDSALCLLCADTEEMRSETWFIHNTTANSWTPQRPSTLPNITHISLSARVWSFVSHSLDVRKGSPTGFVHDSKNALLFSNYFIFWFLIVRTLWFLILKCTPAD